MPAYNFKGQFAAAVESGTKPHTIREVRKRPTRAGDTLFLYTGMRTSVCRLLRVATCTQVTPIKIHAGLCPAVILGNTHMPAADVDALAKRDGFADVEAFFNFFKRTYGECFQGELIEWSIDTIPGDRAVGVKAVCTPQARALGAGEQSPAATSPDAKQPQPFSP